MTDEQKYQNRRPCAIYARSRPAGVGGVIDQILKCRTAAEAYGWIVEQQHVFSDDRHDAIIPIGDRPGIRAMLAAARDSRHPFDTVIVVDVVRFSRKVNEILATYSSLSRAGVHVHVIEGRPKRYHRRQQPPEDE